jgi:hypothetical protein
MTCLVGLVPDQPDTFCFADDGRNHHLYYVILQSAAETQGRGGDCDSDVGDEFRICNGLATITNRRDMLESREPSNGDVEFEESRSERSAAVHTPPQRRHPTYILHLAAILLQRSKKPDSWILASWFYENLVCILGAVEEGESRDVGS